MKRSKLEYGSEEMIQNNAWQDKNNWKTQKTGFKQRRHRKSAVFDDNRH